MLTINDREIRSVLSRLAGELERPRALNAKVARHMRDYVRQTITIQGRPAPWLPLSALYKLKSGKFKAMLSLRERVVARWDDEGAYVEFIQKSGDQFTLRQLERGWSQPAFELPKMKNTRGGIARRKMIIQGPRNANPIYFVRRKGFSVPGRPFFPSYLEAQREAAQVAREHFNDFVRRK